MKSKNIIAGGSKINYQSETVINIPNPISIDKQRLMYEVSQLDSFLESCHNCGVKDLFIGQHNIIFPHGVLHRETLHRNKTNGFYKLRTPIISFHPSNKKVSDKMWELVKKEIG